MNTQIESSLHGVADAVEPPPIDQVAFASRVHSLRKRRRTRLAAVAAAAAAVVVAVPVSVTTVINDVRSADQESAASPTETLLSRPAYFTVEGRLYALAPNGQVHDFAVKSGGILGSSEDRVVAFAKDRTLLQYDATFDGGTGKWSWERTKAPLASTGDVAVMSANGRWLAWQDNRGEVTVFDYAANKASFEIEQAIGHPIAVGPAGVLLRGDRDVWLRSPNGKQTRIKDSGSWATWLAGDVLVSSHVNRSRAYDIVNGRLANGVKLPGNASLSPNGRHISTLVWPDGQETQLKIWAKGVRGWEGSEVRGIQDDPQVVRWLDDETLLVTATSDRSGYEESVLYGCSVISRACEQLETPGVKGPIDLDLIDE